MKKILFIVSTILVLAACNEQDGLLTIQELGVKEKQATLPCTAGTYDIQVLADGEFTLELPADALWLHLSEGRSVKASGDSRITVSYDINRGVQRRAVVSVRRGGKTAEVELTQLGILSNGIEFDCRSVTVPAAAGKHSVRIVTLSKDEDLAISVEYNGDGGWISNFSKSNNYLVFNTIDNAGESVRSAWITVRSISSPDSYDALQICQLPAGGSLTTVGYDSLAGIADGSVSASGLCLEGIVIADNSEGNGAPNKNISASLQDNTLADRTIYIQARDGSAGVKVIFDSIQDNITRRYDALTLLLDGTTVTAYSNPVHYVISGATSANIVYNKAGSPFDVVKKQKHISALTDADIYTFVTLTDCEIPIRKGPFVPIDLRHTHVINRYPMVIRDIEGGTMHLMTNLGATWERDGKGLPQGSGSISGVIVHETCDNFNWDPDKALELTQTGAKLDYVTEIGEIGKYQIRPVARDEIALKDNFEDGFSEMIMEVRYFNKDHNQVVANVKGNTIYSTYPAVEFPASDSAVKGVLEVVGDDGAVTGVSPYRDWTLLGPLVNGEITNTSCGNGVYDYFGNAAYWSIYSLASTTGLILDENGSGWYCTKWTTNKCWRATFSTVGLTAENFPLSVQIGAVEGLGEFLGAPRYWEIEYSVDGDSWTGFGSYTVPDFPILSNRKAWQCPGPKYMSFTMPADPGLLENDKVQVRLHPSNTKAGTPDSYDGGEIVSTRPSQLNYFAIRYNK